VNWSYGITTVPSRFQTTLIPTIKSLKSAGFCFPRLFVDGGTFQKAEKMALSLDLEMTHRASPLRTAGNWVCSLLELYVRNPQSDRFAIFQDDFLCCSNLREYLERCEYPKQGYLNLYLFESNFQVKPPDVKIGWYKSNQLGRGAVALVLSKDAVVTLLKQSYVYDNLASSRGHLGVDGTICTAMNNAGWSEYVHYPSLTFHTGVESTIGHPKYAPSIGFPGEEFDSRNFLDASRH